MVKVPVVPGMSRNEIEMTATSLLRKLQPEALKGENAVDIEEIFEFYIPDRYDIETEYTDLSFLGPDVLGYTDADKKISCIDKTLSDSDDLAVERRFRSTVGHEIGHCIYHVSIMRAFKSSSIRGEGKLYRANRFELRAFEDPEWQAWEFSRACLMPRNLILTFLEKGFSLWEMADHFNVNPAFMEVRLKTLKIKPS